MEIQIDTSLITQFQTQPHANSKNLQKIEDSLTVEIDNFINNSIKVSNLNYNKNFLIKINSFLIENSEDKNLIIYGTILENNQTFYEYSVNDHVFVYIKNPFIINKLISNFIKANSKNFDNGFSMRFEIDESVVLKYELNDSDRNKIYLIMIHLTSIIKIFFTIFLKFKYSKWENILINSKFYEESYLISKILLLLGYQITINISNLSKSKCYTKEDFSVSSNVINDEESKKLELINISEYESNEYNNNLSLSKYFNFLIDTIGDSLSEKVNIFSLLKFDGKVIITSNKFSNNQLSFQLDPRDLEYLANKNISLNFNNIENCVRLNECTGREINFINEMIRKLIENVNIQSIKTLFKKLDIKVIDVNENFKEITVKDLFSMSNYISLYIIS